MRHLFIFLLVVFAGFAQAAPGSNPFRDQTRLPPRPSPLLSERRPRRNPVVLADCRRLLPAAHEIQPGRKADIWRRRQQAPGLERFPANAACRQARLARLRRCRPVHPPQSITAWAAALPSPPARQDQSLASGLQQRSLGWEPAGVRSLLTAPCSLPMLPILAGLVVSGGTPRRPGRQNYVVCMARCMPRSVLRCSAATSPPCLQARGSSAASLGV